MLFGSLISIYQGLEEENLDQKSPGPPGWGLMQPASCSLIIKKQDMPPSLGTERNGVWFPEDGDSCLKNPDRYIDYFYNKRIVLLII